MKKELLTLLCCLFAVLFAGCGEDEPNTPPEPNQIVVENPTEQTAPLKLVFENAIDVAKVTDQDIKVKNKAGDEVGITWLFSNDNRTLTIASANADGWATGEADSYHYYVSLVNVNGKPVVSDGSFGLDAPPEPEPSAVFHVETAGALPTLILEGEKYKITNLTLTGNLDETDMRFIRDMAGRSADDKETIGKLAVLDLSGANFVEEGEPTNSIGKRMFYGCKRLTSITIPDGVKLIDVEAFYKCTGLTAITIPNSVKSIRENAFCECTSLTSVVIPGNVTSIRGNAFYKCTGLTSVVIGNGVTSIEEYTFSRCTSLTSVTIPDKITSIGTGAFYGCTALTAITIPNSVKSISKDAFYKCTGLTSVAIGNGVISIEEKTFAGCTGLTSIVIPDKVTDIGREAFSGCTGLTSIAIPDKVTDIGKEAFSGCTGLTSIAIGSGVKAIKEKAFAYCTGLTSIVIPDNVTALWDNAFYGCTGLISLVIGNGITHINNEFDQCPKLTSVTIGSGLSSIGVYGVSETPAFNGCTGLKEFIVVAGNNKYSAEEGVLFGYDYGQSLIIYPTDKENSNYTIPNGVTSIGWRAFYNCTRLTSITIPNSVMRIYDSAFRGCSGLTSITIPDEVTHIGPSAFRDCSGLTTITIPNRVTTIDINTFYECRGLKEIYSCNPIPPSAWDCFGGIDKVNCIVYVPVGSRQAYQNATGWRDFLDFVEKEMP